MLDAVLKHIRNKSGTFGGLRVIFAAEFLGLGPYVDVRGRRPVSLLAPLADYTELNTLTRENSWTLHATKSS